MPIQDYKISYKTYFRDNRFTVAFSAVHADYRLDINDKLYFAKEIGEKDILIAITAFVDRIEAGRLIVEPVPEVTYTKTEIETLLKEKELLAADDTLEDLKSKDELTATADTKEVG